MKTCRKCGEKLSLDSFTKQVNNKDGLQNHCKPCRAKQHREYQQANKAHLAAYMLEYYHRPDKAKVLKEYQKEWRLKALEDPIKVKKMRDSQLKSKKRKRDEKECTHCSEKATPGMRMCENCRIKHNLKQKERSRP